MKKLTILLYFLSAALTASLIVACGKSGGDANTLPAPTPQGPPVVFGNGKVAFYAQNQKMDRLYPNNGSSYNMHAGMMNVLRYGMRTCDRQAITGGTNGGSGSQTNCQFWLNGFHDIMIFAASPQASSVQMVLRSMPDTSCQNPYYCSSHWVSLPSFKQFILGLFGFNAFNNSNIYNPMVLNMTIWPINNSKGFELRGNAPGYDLYFNSGGLLFQFQVPEGKLEDLAWNYRLVFNGSVAASGRMVRCARPNCDVQGF